MGVLLGKLIWTALMFVVSVLLWSVFVVMVLAGVLVLSTLLLMYVVLFDSSTVIYLFYLLWSIFWLVYLSMYLPGIYRESREYLSSSIISLTYSNSNYDDDSVFPHWSVFLYCVGILLSDCLDNGQTNKEYKTSENQDTLPNNYVSLDFYYS